MAETAREVAGMKMEVAETAIGVAGMLLEMAETATGCCGRWRRRQEGSRR